MNTKPVFYLQTDPKWKDKPYRTPQESSTIGSAGCGPSSMAMVIATWADPKVTPVDTCAWAIKNGYKATGNGTYHSYFVPQAAAYGLECKRINTTSFAYMSASEAEKYHQQAKALVDDGYLMVSLMGKGNWTKGGHYVLWYSNDGDYVLINDPASTKETRARNTFKLFKSEVRFYWAIKPPKEVIPMTNSEVKAYIEQTVKAQLAAGVTPAAPAPSVEPSAWAKDYFYGAFVEGVLDGTNPQGNLTREQMAKVLTTMGMIKPHKCPEGFDWKTHKV